MAVVTGWGRVNETGNISPILRQVDVPVYTNTDCHKTKYGKQAITDNMMCAGYDQGELDACQGDSGGPLHLEGKDRKIDLIGIVQFSTSNRSNSKKYQHISYRCRLLGPRVWTGGLPRRLHTNRSLPEVDRREYGGRLLLRKTARTNWSLIQSCKDDKQNDVKSTIC